MSIYIVKAVGDRDMKSYNVKAFFSKPLALELARKCNAAVHAYDFTFYEMDEILDYDYYREITRPDFITKLDPLYHAGDLQDPEYIVEETELT